MRIYFARRREVWQSRTPRSPVGQLCTKRGRGSPRPAMFLNLLCIGGARPNFMKLAPLVHALGADPDFSVLIVHTGQHYDDQMSGMFFRDLEIPRPDFHLGVGSGSHATQTAEIMKRVEPVMLETCPDAIIVVGDVNSTLAA